MRALGYILISLFIVYKPAIAQSEIHSRDLKRCDWKLTKSLDTTQAFSADTLMFVNDFGRINSPYEMFPDISFAKQFSGYEFEFTFNIFKTKEGLASNTSLRGRWLVDKRARILSLTYYTFNPDKGDNLDDWIKGRQMDYSIVLLTDKSLILVKKK